MITLPSFVGKAVSKVTPYVVKYGPRVMCVGGGLMTAAGAVKACRDTYLHADDILNAHKEQLEKVARASEKNPEAYTADQRRQDKFVIYTRTAWSFIKLYAPSVSLICGGIGLMQSAFNIMENRFTTTMSALTAADKLLEEYRARVVEEVGEEKAAELDNAVQLKTLPEGVDIPEGAHGQVLDDLLDGSYIPASEFVTIDEDPFTLRWDSRYEEWNDNHFCYNAAAVMSEFDTLNRHLQGYSINQVWVDDIFKKFGDEGSACGRTHGYTRNDNCVEYEAVGYYYDKDDDGVIHGMRPIDGDTFEEQAAILRKKLQDTSGIAIDDNGYCIVIRLKGKGVGGRPRNIMREVYGK